MRDLGLLARDVFVEALNNPEVEDKVHRKEPAALL